LRAAKFDHIFYTGGAKVARIVMSAAAKHLTPVTLELGGKSPCIVMPDADLEVTARRIVWGKFLNCGQTCIAPDYILCERETHNQLVPLLEKEIHNMYGKNPAESGDYGRIVSDGHVKRITGLLEGSTAVVGGDFDESERYIAPTVIGYCDRDSALMQEEIFGPILPIVTMEGLDDGISMIRNGEKPLAAYMFSRSQESQQRFLNEVSAGSICINDVLMFYSAPDLPFGGVGESGMGKYHGRHGFETMSHMKAIMKRGTRPDFRLRYPPVSARKLKKIKKFL
jgi:aldehyde dehydrogenase (NAD+)